MGVVIEICTKYPGGRTRMAVADIYPGPFSLALYPHDVTVTTVTSSYYADLLCLTLCGYNINSSISTKVSVRV
jgi:hypothetical protein